MPATAADEGGLSCDSFIAAADTNAGVSKASKGWVYGVSVAGLTAGVKFLKLYDKATTPSEADTPVARIAIPGLTTGAVSNIDLRDENGKGLFFAAGIARRCVGAVADNSTTALSASDVLVNIFYR